MPEKKLDQFIDEDIFWTLPYYCNAPESYMRQKLHELLAKWVAQKRIEETEKYVPPVVSVYDDLLKELGASVENNPVEEQKEVP